MKGNICHCGSPFIITVTTVFCMLPKYSGESMLFDPVFNGGSNFLTQDTAILQLYMPYVRGSDTDGQNMFASLVV